MEDEKYYEEKYKNNQEIFEVINKIKSKNKDIEKFQKIIEKIKQRMKKYDNEIKTVNNWIYIEENKKENFQQMINYIINKYANIINCILINIYKKYINII